MDVTPCQAKPWQAAESVVAPTFPVALGTVVIINMLRQKSESYLNVSAEITYTPHSPVSVSQNNLRFCIPVQCVQSFRLLTVLSSGSMIMSHNQAGTRGAIVERS